jgi:Peptidase family M28
MRSRRFVASSAFVALIAVSLAAQPASKGGAASITEADTRVWLEYLASDALEGRATYTEGLGLAAAYIADHLRQWGVKPVGDNGTYFQTVKVLGVRTTSRSSVTVEVNGKTKTFEDGEAISLPRNMGGKQTVVADNVQFAGYALSMPADGYDDYASFDPKGQVLIWLGESPASVGERAGRLVSSRARIAVERGAVATIAPEGVGSARGGRRGSGQPPSTSSGQGPSTSSGQAPSTSSGQAPSAGSGQAPSTSSGQGPSTSSGQGSGRGGRAAADDGDFTTVQRLDTRVPPAVIAKDEFYEFLFSGSEIKYAELKDKATKGEPMPAFALKGVKLTINIDADYEVTRTRHTRNVVGIVEGSDPKLKNTYVLYGAHYDHTGLREGQPRNNQDPNDRINNGADDDGSGTVALMALARAFALGERPKRSILFVWHAGEESGLLGSRYNADYPIVPLESMVAQINIDMIGRNRDDDPKQSNTVYVVGSDRISTELHNINEEANRSLAQPVTLDYELNDPADPQSFYTRSDHYSYAAKGVPIIFFFTGTHPDYHQASDTVDKILFDKLVRITRLAYETGRRVANLDRPPVRDNKGPRVGRTVKGKIDITQK